MWKFFKDLRKDYIESRAPEEDFLEWFLKRKASIKVRFVFAYFLWGIWIFFWFRIDYFIFLLEGCLVLSILIWIFKKLIKIIRK